MRCGIATSIVSTQCTHAWTANGGRRRRETICVYTLYLLMLARAMWVCGFPGLRSSGVALGARNSKRRRRVSRREIAHGGGLRLLDRRHLASVPYVDGQCCQKHVLKASYDHVRYSGTCTHCSRICNQHRLGPANPESDPDRIAVSLIAGHSPISNQTAERTATCLTTLRTSLQQRGCLAPARLHLPHQRAQARYPSSYPNTQSSPSASCLRVLPGEISPESLPSL